MNLWAKFGILLALAVTVHGDRCRENLDRCARVRDTGFNYELGNRPTYIWVADMMLIDPVDASIVCRDWQHHVTTLTCFRNQIKEYYCWGQRQYYDIDRYIPDEKTLRAAMEIFCDPAKRQEKINMNNCMLLNARENREKGECLREEEDKARKRFGTEVSSNSMCSFFHRRLFCYQKYFGAICKTSLQENTQVYNAITMDEYFDPLRKASICHIIAGAQSSKAGLAVLSVCAVLSWILSGTQ